MDFLNDLITNGLDAYKTATTPSAADVANAQAKANAAKTASLMPIILIGAGVLVVVVVLALVFRKK
jgi:hypothetical protein